MVVLIFVNTSLSNAAISFMAVCVFVKWLCLLMKVLSASVSASVFVIEGALFCWRARERLCLCVRARTHAYVGVFASGPVYKKPCVCLLAREVARCQIVSVCIFHSASV